MLPAQCRYEVLSTKLEVTLVKAEQLAWGSLEKSDRVAAPNYSTPGTEAPRQYPSSGKTKDWSKVESELSVSRLGFGRRKVGAWTRSDDAEGRRLVHRVRGSRRGEGRL